MTLANRITILRIILIPVFVVLFLQKGKYPELNNWTLAIFAFAVLTDMLDGLAARMRRERTPLGTFLDPLADKLLITATYILFAFTDEIALWVFVIVFSRDLIIVLGWTIVYILTSSSKIEPRISGKLCTLFQMITAIMLIYPFPSEWSLWSVRAMVVVTIISAIDYIVAGSRNLEPIPQ